MSETKVNSPSKNVESAPKKETAAKKAAPKKEAAPKTEKKPAAKKPVAKKPAAPKKLKPIEPAKAEETKVEEKPAVEEAKVVTPVEVVKAPEEPKYEKIEDDDFADTRGKQLEQERVIAEEKAAEEAAKKAEEDAKAKEEEEPEEPLPDHFDYEDDDLKACEDARKNFYKIYKKHSLIKTIVSFGLILIFVLMWFLPQWVSALSSYNMVFLIVGAVVALGGLLIYSIFFKRNSQKWIHNYFGDFYGHQYSYVFEGCDIEKGQGLVDLKLQPGEIENCGLFKDVVKTGSRYCYSFKYHNLDSFIIDCAAQTKGGKSFVPVFVGKLLKSKTTYDGSGLYIYFKGNKRALPPNGVSEYNVLEETDKYVIYGEESEKKYLSAARKNAIKKIRTDKVLVDASIVIKKDNLSFYLGYEDSLMIVPMDKIFNPNPTMHFKEDMKVILAIIDELNK